MSFEEEKTKFNDVLLIHFFFYGLCFCVIAKKTFAQAKVKNIFSYVFS